MICNPNLAETQLAFMAYLRQPIPALLPMGYAKQSLDIYVELVNNSINESLSSCFPIIQSILTELEWRNLVADFIAQHFCVNPKYRQIPDEFVFYLQNERLQADDPPFLVELAHYEWIELVLVLAEAEEFSWVELTAEQLLTQSLAFSPLCKLLYYQWPVTKIDNANRPLAPDSLGFCILAFRDSLDQVRFIEVNSASAQFIELLLNQQSASQILAEISVSLSEVDRDKLRNFCLDMLLKLNQQGAIIGILN